jgi:hypothetical protein
LILEPGQSTGRSTAHRIEMKAGDFEWHTGPTTHTITNIGKTRFEAIEAVWK